MIDVVGYEQDRAPIAVPMPTTRAPTVVAVGAPVPAEVDPAPPPPTPVSHDQQLPIEIVPESISTAQERAARIAADAHLQSEIDGLAGSVGSTVQEALEPIIQRQDDDDAERQAAEAAINQALIDEAAARAAGIAAEQAARELLATTTAETLAQANADIEAAQAAAAAAQQAADDALATAQADIAQASADSAAALAAANAEIQAAQAAAAAAQQAADDALATAQAEIAQANADIAAAQQAATAALTTAEAEIGQASAAAAAALAAAQSDLQGAINSTAADLQNAIDAVQASSDGVLADLTTEISARESADAAEITARTAAIAGVQSDIGTVAAALTAEQTARADADSAEIAARQAAVATVQGNVNTVSAALAAEQTARADADSAETAARQAAVSTVQNNINTVSAALTAEATTRANADSAETNARQAAVSSLQGQINDATAAITAEATTRATNDTAETNARTAAVSNLQGQINSANAAITSEATTRATADAAETAARQAAISTVQNNVDTVSAALTAEASTRATADSAETTARQAAISTLQGQVTANTAAITAEATTRATADTAETNARQAAISTLQGQVTANTAAITAEATTRATADTAETNARQAAISTLQGNIDATNAAITSEASTRATADAAETSARQSDVSSLQGQINSANAAITSEATTRAAADSAETSARRAMVSKLSTPGGCIDDPTFEGNTVTSGVPTNWSNSSGPASEKSRVAGKVGTYGVNFNVAGATASYIQIASTNAHWTGPTAKTARYFVVEADFELVSGDLKGAGVLFRGQNGAGGYTDGKVSFYSEIPTPQLGVVYSVRKVVDAGDYRSLAAANSVLYAMANWAGFPETLQSAKSITFHRVQARAATQAEIDTFTAGGAIASSITAAITSEATTRATADTAETNARVAAVSALQTGLDSANAAIASEASTRATADTAETNARQAAISAVQQGLDSANAAIASEATTRANADSAETAARQAAISTVQNNVDTVSAALTAEATTRANADTAETNARQAAISTLQGQVTANTAAITAEAATRATADTAETNARQAAISTLQGQVTANTAAITAEATTRATADTAETNARQAAISTLQGNIDTVSAALTAEASTRATADSAETTARQSAVSSLQGQINSANAAITNEATTRANADAAETAARTVQASKFSTPGGCFADPYFATSPIGSGVVPVGYGNWTGSTSIFSITAAGARFNDRVLKMDAPAAQGGLLLITTSAAWVNYTRARYLVVEADVELLAGTFANSGMHLVRKVNQGDTTNAGAKTVSFETIFGAAPTLNRVYQVRQLVDLAAEGDYTLVYLMANWTGFPGATTSAKTMLWHRAQVRPATTEEINTYTAGGAIASAITAAITSEATTRATADTAETNARQAAISTVQGNIDAVNAALTSEATTRATADTAETNARQAAISTVQGNIDAVNAALTSEASTRATADTAETNARTAAVSNLQGQVTANAAAITSEATTRANADTAETNARQAQVSSVQAAADFEAAKVWNFDSSVEGWTVNSGQGTTAVASSGSVQINAGSTDPQFISPALSFDSSIYKRVRARVKRVAGAGWDGKLFYAISGGHSYSLVAGQFASVAQPANISSDWCLLDFDMSATDWAGTITSIRLDLGNTAADKFLVDWVAIGRIGPAKSVEGLAAVNAAIVAEQNTRATADTAETNARQAAISGVQTQLDSTIASLSSEATTRATADSAETSARQAAVSGLQTGLDSVNAAIIAEQTTRAAADLAEANSRRQQVSQLSTPGGCLADPYFVTSPIGSGAVPVGYANWTGSLSNYSITTTGARFNDRVFKMDVPASLAGILIQSTYANWVGVTRARYVVLEADVELTAGTFANSGMYLVRKANQGDAANLAARILSFETEFGSSPTLNRVYQFRKVIDLSGEGDFTLLYMMANWTSFPGATNSVKTLLWHRVQIRPASTEEINTFTAGGPISSAISSAITSEATTRATADAAETLARQNAVSALQNGLDSANAAIANEATTRATADSAEATARLALATTVNGQSTSISQLFSTTDGIKAMWGVQIDNNGQVTGRVKLDGTGGTSTFSVLATSFTVSMPGYNSPIFEVGNVNGSPKVTIRADVVADGSITDGKVGNVNLNAPTFANGSKTASVTIALRGGQAVAIVAKASAVDLSTANESATFSIKQGATVLATENPLTLAIPIDGIATYKVTPAVLLASFTPPSDGNYTFTAQSASSVSFNPAYAPAVSIYVARPYK